MPKNSTTPRNDRLFDKWSIVHLVFGIALGSLLAPSLAVVMLVIWEPVERFIISPLLARLDIAFGRETVKNSLSDIFFGVVGVLVGVFVGGA